MIAEAIPTANGEGASVGPSAVSRDAESSERSATPPAGSSVANGTQERDAQGRFVAGNKGGPGNPYARQVAQLKQALLDAVGPDDVAAIAQALIAKAKEGNVPAARLVFSYVLGKPSPPIDPDRLDAGEWQNLKETAGMFQELPGLVNKPGPELPLTIVRSSRPAIARELGSTFRQALLDPERAEEIFYPQQAPTDAEPRKGNRKPLSESAPPSANGDNGAGLQLRRPPELPGAPSAGRFSPPLTKGGQGGVASGQHPNSPTPYGGGQEVVAAANGSNGDRAVEAWYHGTWEDYLAALRDKMPPSANAKKRRKGKGRARNEKEKGTRRRCPR